MKNIVGIFILILCTVTVLTNFLPVIILGLFIWLIFVVGMAFEEWCNK